MKCEFCGWLGLRQQREVNLDHVTGKWICAKCWFARGCGGGAIAVRVGELSPKQEKPGAFMPTEKTTTVLVPNAR